MKNMQKIIASGLFLGMALSAYPVVSSAEPKLTIQEEQKAHPKIHAAIVHMEEALKEMEAAPHDFGGNKAKAIADTKAAIHSLKKALYYRLKMDDAAIDKAQ